MNRPSHRIASQYEEQMTVGEEKFLNGDSGSASAAWYIYQRNTWMSWFRPGGRRPLPTEASWGRPMTSNKRPTTDMMMIITVHVGHYRLQNEEVPTMFV